jgi:hypothetical protein
MMVYYGFERPTNGRPVGGNVHDLFLYVALSFFSKLFGYRHHRPQPSRPQNSAHSSINRRRFSNKSPRLYAASTAWIACANAISQTSRGRRCIRLPSRGWWSAGREWRCHHRPPAWPDRIFADPAPSMQSRKDIIGMANRLHRFEHGDRRGR